MAAKLVEVVAVRITVEEAAALDEVRGSLTRSQYLRRLLLDGRKNRLKRVWDTPD